MTRMISGPRGSDLLAQCSLDIVPINVDSKPIPSALPQILHAIYKALIRHFTVLIC